MVINVSLGSVCPSLKSAVSSVLLVEGVYANRRLTKAGSSQSQRRRRMYGTALSVLQPHQSHLAWPGFHGGAADLPYPNQMEKGKRLERS